MAVKNAPDDSSMNSVICAIGDVHGHLQLALCVAARWQIKLAIKFDAVFLCGDVGSFTADAQLDSTTRRHGKSNPCELEFLHQWSIDPQPPHIRRIFQPEIEDGLGLQCPVVMVHGNHEGFSHLDRLIPKAIPKEILDVEHLPTVDSGGWIRYLPSGWKCMIPGGLVVAGIGGIERGQRFADYHNLAYLDDDAIEHLLSGQKFDALITHQGPSSLHTEAKGSPTLELLAEEEKFRAWFHGHSIVEDKICWIGRRGNIPIVPLHDVAFPAKGPNADDPGDNGWCCATFSQEAVMIDRRRPSFWRDYRRKKWSTRNDGQLVSPDLSHWQ